MRLIGAGDFRNPFTDQRVRNDELRFPVVALLGDVQRIEELLHIVAVDFLDIESISFKSRAGVLALRLLCRRIKRDRIGIVNQDQIIETEMPGEGARFRGNALLHATIAGQTNDMLIENSMLISVETRRGHFHCDCDPGGVADALSKWTSRAFHTGCFAKFRMSWRFRCNCRKRLISDIGKS